MDEIDEVYDFLNDFKDQGRRLSDIVRAEIKKEPVNLDWAVHVLRNLITGNGFHIDGREKALEIVEPWLAERGMLTVLRTPEEK